MLRNKLSVRLIVTSTLWVTASLVTTGVLLVLLFRSHIEKHYDRALHDHLEELVAASDVGEGLSMKLSWTPADARFNIPLSGWYWQIDLDGGVVAKSKSLPDDILHIVEPKRKSQAKVQYITGPKKERLRAIAQKIKYPESTRPFNFIIASPAANVDKDVAEFAESVAVSLGVLGITLFGVVFVQVFFGLKPLRDMRQTLANIRAGKEKRFHKNFPEEVQPVISELNDLLDYNATLLERARTQVGNLAHAMKNPLSVIRNEAKKVDGERGDLMRQQLDIIKDDIDHRLSSARIFGAGVLGSRAAVCDILADLEFSMNILHKDKKLTLQTNELKDKFFHGDAHDFEEMLGNIIDNACKFCQSTVSVYGHQDGNWLLIDVEDDGPGIPEDMRQAVMKRGQRLDEKLPGSGLGLNITKNIAELYRGSLELSQSPLGGLGVRLKLPAID